MTSNDLLSRHFEALYPADTRLKPIEQILGFVKAGNSCQLIALPGSGRGNILGFLSYNKAIREKHLGEKQKWFHFVLVNFQEIRKRPLFDATKLLFLVLVDSLKERGMKEEYEVAKTLFKESLRMNDELVLFHGLKKLIDLLAIEKELTIVFLFDRFEEYTPMVTQQFFTNLRLLRDRAKYRFSVVFSLNRPLDELLEPSLFADFYEFVSGHTVFLPLIDKPGMDFRIAYLEKITGKAIDKKTQEAVISLTAGHMKLTRLAFESILADNPAIASLSESKVKQSQSDGIATSPTSPRNDNDLETYLLSQKTIRGALYEIWNFLTPAEQSHVLKDLFGKEHEDEHTKMLAHLGLATDSQIAIPLFNTFAKQTFKADRVSKEKIRYNSDTNEIYDGDLLLSDKLTALEFKTLRFFIQNADKVVSREELIAAVWNEAKSTAGVTDQALDQLVFRIRKKIEETPTNPLHLQTVKGRGFRFTS